MKEDVRRVMEILKDNFYFKDKVHGTNRMEYDNDCFVLFVYNSEDPLYINGADDIGLICHVLNLCCSVQYNKWKERIEFRIH